MLDWTVTEYSNSETTRTITYTTTLEETAILSVKLSIDENNLFSIGIEPSCPAMSEFLQETIEKAYITQNVDFSTNKVSMRDSNRHGIIYFITTLSEADHSLEALLPVIKDDLVYSLAYSKTSIESLFLVSEMPFGSELWRLQNQQALVVRQTDLPVVPYVPLKERLKLPDENHNLRHTS